MPSAGGLNAGDMKVSMQCAIASMPVAAVSAGGRPSVSSGSQIATLGHDERRDHADLAAVVEDQDRAARPTSLPVPAVVGTAMTGAVRE